MVRRLAPVPSVAAEVHGSDGTGDRTSHDRTDPALSRRAEPHTEHERNGAECRSDRTDPSRSGVHAARGELGPNGGARKRTSDRFDSLIARRFSDNEDWATNKALGIKCGRDEAVIRKWRNGEKAIPLAALLVLPAPLVGEIVRWILDERAAHANRRGLAMLHEARERMEQPVAPGDVADTLDALETEIDHLTARARRLRKEGK